MVGLHCWLVHFLTDHVAPPSGGGTLLVRELFYPQRARAHIAPRTPLSLQYFEASGLEILVRALRFEYGLIWGDSNPGWYGNIRGKVEASIARSKAVYSKIDSHALGGLKTRMVFANSTARQTEV